MNAARILVPTLFLTACGGDFSSDLETDRRVSTLSEYEAISLCQSATEHVSSAMEAAQWTDYLCTSVAVGEYVTNEFDARSDARRDCEQATYECTGSREIYGRTFRDFVDCSEIEDYDYEDCRPPSESSRPASRSFARRHHSGPRRSRATSGRTGGRAEY